MAYAAALSEMSLTDVLSETGTEMPNPLFSQTKITPSFHTEARFMASWVTPWLEAPSPKNATAT